MAKNDWAIPTLVIGVVLIGLFVIGGGIFLWTTGFFAPKEVIPTTQAGAATPGAVTVTSTGKAATLKVLAYDLESNTPGTTTANVPFYLTRNGEVVTCGDAVALASTATSITGCITSGQKLEYVATNNTFSMEKVLPVKGSNADGSITESESLKIDVRALCSAGKTIFTYFKDTSSSSAPYGLNLSGMVASSSVSFDKIRFKVNGSDCTYPLGGFYVDRTSSNSNISNIDVTGSAAVFGTSKSSTSIIGGGNVKNDRTGRLPTSRQAKDDFVFEIDDNPSEAGNQVLWLSEADYLDTGSFTITSNGQGCPAASTDTVTPYAFNKLLYKSQKDARIYGPASADDADTPSVLGTDVTGPITACNSATV